MGSELLDAKLQTIYARFRREELKSENPRLTVRELATQIVTEWDSFGWEQKQRLIEYVKAAEGVNQPDASEGDGAEELIERAKEER